RGSGHDGTRHACTGLHGRAMAGQREGHAARNVAELLLNRAARTSPRRATVTPPRHGAMSDLAPAVHAVAAPVPPAPGPAPPAATRPREKLRQRGLAALTDADLLALLLGSGTTGRSAWRIARALARVHPAELAGWPVQRWARVPGIGPAR